MQTFLDQISAFQSGAPVNSLQNNELYRQLPAAGLFSSLLSEYSSGPEDANIAALGGNFLPAMPAQNSPAATADSLAGNSAEVSSGTVATAVNKPVLSAISLATEPAVPQAQIPGSVQSQQVLANTTNKELSNANLTTAKNSTNVPSDHLNLAEETHNFSKLPLNDSGKLENIARPSGVDQPLPPVNHQTVRESQSDSRVSPARNAAPQVLPAEQPAPVTENLNVRERQSEVAAKSPVTVENTIAAKTKPFAEAVTVKHDALPEHSQIKPPQSQSPNATNAPVNLLDPRERLLLPTANSPVRNSEDGVLIDAKISPDTTRPAGNPANEVINRSVDQNRFAFDAETIASQRKQETLTQFDATDVRKESIIASTVVREQNEYTKQLDDRVSLQQKPEDLYKIVNAQERPVARPDYSSTVQQNFVVESAPVVKIVEINIDQKTPVTINIGADAVSSLKPVSSDYQLLPSREILQSDSGLQATRSGEIRNGNDIADQIAWARQNNAQHVRISVSPEHLGAVDISIDDAAEGLNIQFVTQNLQAKEALELFMPRLKEMLEQSGLNLQNASVSQQGESKNQFNLSDQGGNELQQQDTDDGVSVAHADEIHHQASGPSNQLLDAFA